MLGLDRGRSIGLLACGIAACAASQPVPPKVPVVAPVARVVQIETGADSTCALLFDGRVYCWGKDVIAIERPHRRKWALEAVHPFEVVGLPRVAELAGGDGFWCARAAADGRVFCWGRNDRLQLGRETLVDRDYRPLPVPKIVGAARLVAGESIACARSEAGAVQCWGGREVSAGPRSRPLRAGRVVVHGWNLVAARTAESLAITNRGEVCARFGDGHVGCWTPRWSGGRFSLRARKAADESVAIMAPRGSSDRAPGLCVMRPSASVVCEHAGRDDALGSPQRFLSRSPPVAGSEHMCNLTPSRAVACRGSNFFGQLGRDPDRSGSPETVAVFDAVEQLVAGAHHTCALTDEGRVLCWGRSQFGQLGTGTGDFDPTPTDVTDAILRAAAD